MMRIAAWNHPVNHPVMTALQESGIASVEATTIAECIALLKSGVADVALLPSEMALGGHADMDVLPAVAVSSWVNPYAALVIGDQLGAPTLGIMHGPEGRPSALLAAIILKEHYQTSAVLNEQATMPDGIASHALITVPLEGLDSASKKDVLSDEEKAEQNAAATTLDLGLEWSEMASYPFVWSVFVCRRDEASDKMIIAIRDAMKHLDTHRVEAVQRWDLDSVAEDFFLNELRVTMDDLAVASLTELCDHLFFYGITEEVLPVQFATLQNPSSDED